MSARLQEGEKVYISLFEIMDKEKSGERELKVKLKNRFPEAVFEPASKHLYKALMRSLKSFDAEKSIENKLMNLISDVRILFTKGILPLCFSEIERGKKLSLKHEKFFLFLQLARMELQYLTALEFPHVDETELVRRQEKINDILYYELFINKHSSLYELLSHRYAHQGITRSENEIEKLNDLLLEEYQVNANQHYGSFESDKLHLHFQSTYFMMTGNPEQSLQEFYQLNKLFEENEFHWEADPVYYIYLIHGILMGLRWMGKHDDMIFFIHRLEQIKPNARSHELFIRHLILQHQLAIFIDRRKFQEGLPLIVDYEPYITNAYQAPPNVFATTHFQISVIYFGMGDFRKSLQHINKVLDVGAAFISYQIYGLCRLVSLLIHVELENDDHLIYSIRSAERKFKTEKKLYRVEKLTIDFVRRWIHRTPLNSNEILINYYEDLLKLKEDKFENQFLKQFIFLPWIEAKIAGSREVRKSGSFCG